MNINLSGKNKELVVLIDDSDYELVSKYKWYLNKKGYAQRNRKQVDYSKDRLPVLMHKFLVGSMDGLTVDHVNNNKLDNRRENLRFISNTNNIRRRGPDKRTTTGYKGVYRWWSKNLAKDTIRYTANIRVNKVLKFLGYFKDKKEAAITYNEASKKYHGEFGFQNKIE